MTSAPPPKFDHKHLPGSAPDPLIQEAIRQHASQDELPCAVAFQIAADLKVTPAAVGQTLDLMGCRLVKCQLGLFGYSPKKRIVKPQPPDAPEVAAAIQAALENERLPCRAAWEIAERFKLRKMAVSGACEALGIKIKPCQLGAF
jgi:hypothetical protein